MAKKKKKKSVAWAKCQCGSTTWKIGPSVIRCVACDAKVEIMAAGSVLQHIDTIMKGRTA